MPTASEIEALRWVVEVRWPLLESYALARQEGFAEPVGLVLDANQAYAKALAQHLLVSANWDGAVSRTVTCMERAVVLATLSPHAPEVAAALRQTSDEPGRWTAVILAERGWVLTGTWQELMTATAEPKEQRTKSRAR